MDLPQLFFLSLDKRRLTGGEVGLEGKLFEQNIKEEIRLAATEKFI